MVVLSSTGEVISDVKNGYTLDLVQVIFRHGERIPIEQEANMFNITDSSEFENDFGMLTKRGMMQEYKLGQMLRERYDQHLGKYKEDKVQAVSTISSRTKMSLELVLAGLFPTQPDEQWHPELKWQPIPYDIVFPSKDVFLSPHQNPKFLKLWINTMAQNKEYHAKVASYTKLFKSIEKLLKTSLMDNILFYVGYTSSMLRICKILNHPLPTWCSEDIYVLLEEFFIYLVKSMSCTIELKKFNGGPMIKTVIENIKKNNKEKKKIYLNSTHDLSLHGFTEAQNLIDAFDLPPFGACYIVESYKDSKNQDYVRILSWDGISDNFTELRFSNFKNFMSLEKYEISVRHILPTDDELKNFQADSESQNINNHNNNNDNDNNNLKALSHFNLSLSTYFDVKSIVTSTIASVIAITTVFYFKKQYSLF